MFHGLVPSAGDRLHSGPGYFLGLGGGGSRRVSRTSQGLAEAMTNLGRHAALGRRGNSRQLPEQFVVKAHRQRPALRTRFIFGGGHVVSSPVALRYRGDDTV
jgi:hypothetical protein